MCKNEAITIKSKYKNIKTILPPIIKEGIDCIEFHPINSSKKNIDIEVDGGIKDTNAKNIINAGANILVAGSYIFSNKDYKKAIESLKQF